MTKALDDLEAVRTLVQALEPFESADQERIIRWTREKLGLHVVTQETLVQPAEPRRSEPHERGAPSLEETADIKTFVAEKAPGSDNQFAATVAYYYMFVATDAEKKDSIDKDDLLEACRLASRQRIRNPAQTLVNAHNAGLLDKASRGQYSINTVGENLVAMTLPTGSSASSARPKAAKRKQAKPRNSSKKAKGSTSSSASNLAASGSNGAK